MASKISRRDFLRGGAAAFVGTMMFSGIASAEEATGMDSWEAFSDTVTLQIPVYDRGAEGVPDVSDNYWTQWIQENFGDQYNINVEFVPITRTDVMTDYALLASSQSLPTILMEYDYDKLASWAVDGYLQEYDVEEFAKIAPTYYQNMIDNEQLGYIELAGGNYLATAERPYYNTGYTWITWVREDWLEEVGWDHIPSGNSQDYLDAMTAIKEAGLADYPAGGAMLTGVGSDQTYGYRDFPQDGEHWAMYGDYQIPSLSSVENRRLLKFENQKYNLGLTNPEYYTIDTETEKSNFINGQTYGYSGYISSTIDWLESFYEQNPDATLAVVVQNNELNDLGYAPAYRADNPFGMLIGFSSQASEDEIKAAMMYMEWMSQEDVLFTMQWGIEGETFNYGDDGLPVSVDYDAQPSDYKQGYNNSKDYWCVVIESKNAGTIEDTITSNTPQNLPQNFTQEVIDNYYARLESAEMGWAVSDCMFGDSLESVTEYQETLVNLYVELRDKLVTASEDDFDSLYEEYAQQYLDAGYQEVIDERLALYQEGLTTTLPEYENAVATEIED
ncbi:MAG: substrate-binding domain-containing protein [Lachnospiraceae bacterium]|nr:substrate-binding domain-containing protein [Lachnospiraceae bacterium]